MSAEFLAAVSAIQEPSLAPLQQISATSAPAVAGSSFGNLVSEGLQQVNQQLATSQVGLQSLAAGDVQNLHHVMIQLEESRFSFQLMLQVRNRLLESYQEMMRMQV